MIESSARATDYRWDVRLLLGDLNRRDRQKLLAELDRMLGELPPDASPSADLGSPAEIAATPAPSGQPSRARGHAVPAPPVQLANEGCPGWERRDRGRD